MKISEMNNCIEEMRKCYNFKDDKTEIHIGDIMNRACDVVSIYTKDENGTEINMTRHIEGKMK